MQIHLNGNDITNREQLHDALSEALELPEWYGRSLDALYDCLTDLSVPTTIHVENWPEEDYMQRALAVLRDAADSSHSVALVQEGRAAAYLLAAPSEDGGCALLSAVRRTGAPAWAFTALLTELVNRCYYRMGGDFPFYFSALTPRVERLALRLMGERFADYEEHTCSLAVPGKART